MATGADAETGRGGRPGEKSPERTCIVTREVLSPDDLIRFVVDPEGAVVPDVARRLPGRGVWVACGRATLAEAIRAKAFARAFKRQVTVADDLPDTVDRLLARRALERLALANKAGRVATGFTKVDAMISHGEAVALLHATEAAADGRDRLDRKYVAVARSLGRDDTVVTLFQTDELSLAIGRGNVVHAALSDGGATRAFLTDAGRLARFRSGTSAFRALKPAGKAG